MLIHQCPEDLVCRTVLTIVSNEAAGVQAGVLDILLHGKTFEERGPRTPLEMMVTGPEIQEGVQIALPFE